MIIFRNWIDLNYISLKMHCSSFVVSCPYSIEIEGHDTDERMAKYRTTVFELCKEQV
jgi:hypothetical protein